MSYYWDVSTGKLTLFIDSTSLDFVTIQVKQSDHDDVREFLKKNLVYEMQQLFGLVDWFETFEQFQKRSV